MTSTRLMRILWNMVGALLSLSLVIHLAATFPLFLIVFVLWALSSMLPGMFEEPNAS